MSTNKSQIKSMLNENNLSPKKSLGQNFLYDENVLKKIVDLANINNNDFVLEIGPGLGSLTRLLLDTGAKVTAVEIDKNLSSILKDKFSKYDNFELIEGDFLEVYKNIKPCNKCVANLPYYITSPIIMKVLSMSSIKETTFMIQKEVCDRIFANPSSKDYGILTLAIKYFSDPVDKFIVSKTCFFPEPNVDSAVLKLIKHDKYTSKNLNEEKLFSIIKASFSQRRKKLANSLSSVSGIDKNFIIECLSKINFDENVRAENLSIDDFITLSSLIDQK